MRAREIEEGKIGHMSFLSEKSRPDSYDKIVTAVLDRLVEMIRKRYHCNLRYRPFSRDDALDQLKKHLMYSNQPVQLNDQWVFPVHLKRDLVGAAEVTPAHKLTVKQVQSLTDVIRLVLESTLLTANSLDHLARLEEKMRTSEFSPTNVVPLDAYLKTKIPMVEPEDLDKPPRRLSFSVPCLIESNNFDDLTKMALELHHNSKRQAFIHIEELSSEVTRSADELRALGSFTIFIADICSLDKEQQLAIKSYLSGRRTRDNCQIIAGTLRSYAQLVRQDLVDHELLRRMSVAYLRMTKPFNDYMRSGVIEFFYSSLTGQKVEDRLF